jgi:hypothetical protein
VLVQEEDEALADGARAAEDTWEEKMLVFWLEGVCRWRRE